MAKNRGTDYTIEDEINYRIIRGDAYPGFMWMLTHSRERKMSTGSVNVAAEVLALKGRWIGLRFYVMTQDRDAAKEIIPAVAGLLKGYGFEGTSDGIIRMFGESMSVKDPENPTTDIWPKEAPPLVTSGTREASYSKR